MKSILITGGAGYVGSQSVLHFQSLGWRTIVLDNFATGHRDFGAISDRLVVGDVRDRDTVRAILTSQKVDGILHCAARSIVKESMARPLDYLEENIGGGIALIREAVEAGGVPIVFSSSASVYGEPKRIPVHEDDPKAPVNAYGFTKMAIEDALRWTSHASGLRSVALRYFNACGADPQARTGERHDPETHLIPNTILAALQGEQRTFRIFGRDYDTRDGTALRDYTHTLDIARAHEKAFRYLWDGGETTALNVGTGHGATVREIVRAASEALDVEIPFEYAAPRPGDPSVLLADATRAREVLGWAAEYSDITTVLQHAVAWHRKELLSRAAGAVRFIPPAN